jgi:NADH dehydrogenase FAD-containing subunit
MGPSSSAESIFTSVNKHLVFVGAGHAHLHSLSHCSDFVEAGTRVTMIAPGHFWHTEMGPGLLSGIYPPRENAVNVREMVEAAGGRFIRDGVTHINPHQRELMLGQHPPVSYDVLSLDVGSEIPCTRIPGAGEFGLPAKPTPALLSLREKLRNNGGPPQRLVVLGGGATGCEIAANLRPVAPRAEIVLVTSDTRLLENEGAMASRLMSRVLIKELKLRVLTGETVERVNHSAVVLETGFHVVYDVLILATGLRPSPLMRRSGLKTDSEGALTVNRYLQSILFPEIFGAGDCVHFGLRPLDPDGFHAIREGRVLHHNLKAYLTRRRLHPFHPLRSYPRLFNLGDGTGLLSWNGIAIRSRWVFRFKDFLDRRFVAHFSPREHCD